MRNAESLENYDNREGQIKIKNPSYRAVNELSEVLLQSVSSERERKKEQQLLTKYLNKFTGSNVEG